MNLRTFALALPLVIAYSGQALAADLPMTAEEFRLWRDYQAAAEDPKVQKMPEKERLPAIARNFSSVYKQKITVKDLSAAIAKGDQFGAGIGKQAEDSIRAALADTEFAARIKEVKVDTSASHVVTYVAFTTDKPETLDREACLAVVRARKGAALASTIKVAIADPADAGKVLFEGLISAESADRINEGRIVDFASTRYLKLFEKVKRAE